MRDARTDSLRALRGTREGLLQHAGQPPHLLGVRPVVVRLGELRRQRGEVARLDRWADYALDEAARVPETDSPMPH